MLQRCNNFRATNYERYGGRGIKVCERWHTFENFYADMGDCPDNYTLERLDNNGDYCPENCQWATDKEQANNRRSNLVFSHQGKTQNLSQWLEYFNKTNQQKLDYCTVLARIHRNWRFINALTLPPFSLKVDNNRTRYITFNGKTQNIKKWVNEFNNGLSDPISYNVVKSRLNGGWEFLDALNIPVFHGKYNNKSLTQLIEEHNANISPTTVRKRLKKGWELIPAITTPIITRQEYRPHNNYLLITHDNKTQPLAQWVEEFNKKTTLQLTYTSVYYRITHKWTFLEALTTPKRKGKK